MPSSWSLSVEWTSAGEAHLGSHGCGATAEFGGCEDVAGLVDEGAGEVLGFGEDHAFVEPTLHFGLVLAVCFGAEDGERVEAGVLALGAIGVDVEVGDERAFEERTRGEFAGKRIEVLVGEGAVFGEGDGDVANAAGFGEADGCAGALADLVRGEGLDLAQADDDEALCACACGAMQRERFAYCGLELTGCEPACGGVSERVGGGQQRGRGVIFAGGDIDREDGEKRGCEARWVLEEKPCIHSFIVLEVAGTAGD